MIGPNRQYACGGGKAGETAVEQPSRNATRDR
jgi:hypothetical protein